MRLWGWTSVVDKSIIPHTLCTFFSKPVRVTALFVVVALVLFISWAVVEGQAAEPTTSVQDLFR